MRRFCLFKRGPFYYVQFKNQDSGTYGTAISTRQSVRDEAVLTVGKWLEQGIPVKSDTPLPVQKKLTIDGIIQTIRDTDLTPDDAERIVDALKRKELINGAVIRKGTEPEPLITFLERFWSYEDSPYVKEKLAHGHRIGKRHCIEMAGSVNIYWKPYFKDLLLSELTKARLKEFSLHVAENDLVAKSINRILSAGTVALKWAYVNDMIPVNPVEGLRKFSGKCTRRGIFTQEETKRLFALEWKDERSKLGNALAMTTGLRAGEILALRVVDIKEDRLHIRHSWSNQDGLKQTKTGEERFVPLLGSLKEKLMDLARRNPFGFHPGSFVFWSMMMPERPMDFHFLLDSLTEMKLRLILKPEEMNNSEKISEAKRFWKERNVVFHSWRHFYSTRLADKLEARTVMVATGHKNQAMFESYADHASAEQFERVKMTVEVEFAAIL
jgi:integrase